MSQFPEAENEEETFREYGLRLLKTKFIETIPSNSIKELQPKYLFPFGALAHIFSLGCFIYFIWKGFIDSMSVQFISLNKNDGRCSQVLKPVTGTFIGDAKGYWFGQPNFDASLGKYYLQLQNFEQSNEQYTSMMKTVDDELTELGRMASKRDLADNLLLWMTWQTTLKHSKTVNTFYMTGNPLVAFDRDLHLGLFTSIAGECLVPTSTEFDESVGKFKISTNATAFRTDKVCSKAAVPENLGYNSYYDYETFEVGLDTRTAAVAAAVNTRIIDIESLNKITVTERRFVYNGTNITMNQRFSDRYPGMIPTRCFFFNEKEFCLIRIGTTYGYPIMLHFGTNQNFPKRCNCTQGDAKNYPYCHTFDFMLGFLFYNLPSTNDEDDENSTKLPLSALALLTLMTQTNLLDLNERAYNISYAASMYDTELYETFQQPSWRKKAYEFCTLDQFGACSLLLFNAFDSNSHSVSDYNYQLRFGACRDSFTSNNWNILADTPPTDLTQTYYECTQEPRAAILASIGIASGNTATFVPIFLLLAVPLLFGYLQLTGNLPPKKEYSKQETDAAIETLALLMLRIRDGKIRGIVPNGTLKRLTDELIKSAKNEGGYPDSDDEDEDLDGDDVEKQEKHHKVHKRGSAKGVSSVFISHHHNHNNSNGNNSNSNSNNNNGNNQETSSPEKASSSWFSSFFSSSTSQSTVPTESPIHGVELSPIPPDVQVLNETALSVKTGTSSIEGNDILECVKHLNIMMKKAASVKGRDGSVSIFRSTENKSSDLKRFDLTTLRSDEIPIVFNELYETLLNHIKVHYGDMYEGKEDKFGYNIGGRIYIASQIKQFARSDNGKISNEVLIL